MREIESDGFITDEIYIQETPPRRNVLELVGEDKAKPMEKCGYPDCERCIHYVASACTIPIVVSKQMYLMTEERIAVLERNADALGELVYGEILHNKTRVESGNYSVEHEGYHKQVVGTEEVWCPDGMHIETHDGIDYYMLDKPFSQANIEGGRTDG